MKRRFLKVGMTEDLYIDLQFKSNNLNISLSEYSRQMLMNGKIIEKDKKNNIQIIYHLNKIGNNINQIARFANSNKSLDIQIYNLLVEIKLYIENLSDDNISK